MHGKQFFLGKKYIQHSVHIALRTECIVLLIAFTFLTACVTQPQINTEQDERDVSPSSYIPESIDWQSVCSGIRQYDFENRTLPIRWHIVEIDLDTPGLALVCFPDSSTQKRKDIPIEQQTLQPFFFTSMETAQFAKNTGCIIAMNATPFAGRTSSRLSTCISRTRQIMGIHKIDGIEIAAPIRTYSALAFTYTADTNKLRAKIIMNQTDASIADQKTVLGGFFTILKDGAKRSFNVSTHDSRSAAGVSKDGRFLYLLAVEGERPSKSIGLSFPQCADILLKADCFDALEFDGGSSTDLCVNGKSVLSYKVTTVQGNSFGFIKR